MYDASFKYWPWAVDTLLSAAGKSLNMTEGQTNQFVQKKLVASICSTATKYCKDKDAQYHTPQQCEEYLTKNVRFGKAYELGMFPSFLISSRLSSRHELPLWGLRADVTLAC